MRLEREAVREEVRVYLEEERLESQGFGAEALEGEVEGLAVHGEVHHRRWGEGRGL